MKPSSVCLCPVDQQQQRRAAGLLLSAPRAGDIDRQRATALTSTRRQCNVDSRGMRLYTDLLILLCSVDYCLPVGYVQLIVRMSAFLRQRR